MKKLLLTICSLSLISCTFYSTKFAQLKSKPHHNLRVTSYNMYWKNGVCTTGKPNAEVRMLKKVNADVVLVQELTDRSNRCLDEHLSKIYPYRSFKNYCNEGGLATYSKYPFKTLQFILPEYSRFPAWIVLFKTPYGPIQAANVHLQPQVDHNDNVGLLGIHMFSSAKVRIAEIDKIVNHLDRRFHNTIIAGDFNESDYGGAVRKLRKIGFTDAILKDKKLQYTWKWQFGPIKTAHRYDRIFYHGDMCLSQVQVLHEGNSDHYPVIVDLEVRHTGHAKH